MAHTFGGYFSGYKFWIIHDYDEHLDINDFKYHNHDDIYEIVLLLNGDCEFHVEGNTYRLKQNDIVLTRPFEMHHMVFRSNTVYDRIVLYLSADYFKDDNAKKFLDVFENRELGTGNLVISDITDTKLVDCMMRIQHYATDGAIDVASSVITEFLYLLNKSKVTADNFYTKNERVRDIIMYINNNLTENLSLDSIANEFFIAKHYMCKIFKKSTGHSIHQYINYKRILLVQELHKGGQPLIHASMNAGFNSYANFYKAYVKQNGTPPKTMN